MVVPSSTATFAAIPAVKTLLPTHTDTPVPTPTPTATPVVLGPEQFPSNVNPLTGLQVADPSNLALIPALVSISTFPASARPEAGLGSASWVFEAFIGEGMTRYLGIYYGEYPAASSSNGGSAAPDASIGPIRSGRTWYEDARELFSGFIVMASASANVMNQLNGYTSFYGSDEGNINSALIPVDALKAIAGQNKSRLINGALGGNIFDVNPPADGKPAESIWIRWSFYNQVFWRYDDAAGSYHRYQNGITDETSQVFKINTDRLNGEPLTFENLVMLFVNYRIKKFTNIRIDMLDTSGPALLFRDGQMYKIRWTTVNDDFSKQNGVRRPIRFLDVDGNPFPLKPGQTWLEVLPMYTPYYETVDSEDILKMLNNDVPGSGHWAVVFYTPPNTP